MEPYSSRGYTITLMECEGYATDLWLRAARAVKPLRWWSSHVFHMWHVMHSSPARGNIHWLRSQTLLTPPTLQWLATGHLPSHIHDLDEKWQSHAQLKRVWLRFVVTVKLLFGLGQPFWNFSDVLVCSSSPTRWGLYGTKFCILGPKPYCTDFRMYIILARIKSGLPTGISAWDAICRCRSCE